MLFFDSAITGVGIYVKEVVRNKQKVMYEYVLGQSLPGPILALVIMLYQLKCVYIHYLSSKKMKFLPHVFQVSL